MNFPELKNTPIQEIIFSISFNEIVDNDFFFNFLKLEKIKENFKDVKPAINQKIEMKEEGIGSSSVPNGFHLKNDCEVLQIKKGSFSYHYLNGYKDYTQLLNSFCEYWNAFNSVSENNLLVTNYSVRYINVIEIDDENKATHLVQLYPKQSVDRKILNFQNSINFYYEDNPNYKINVISTKVNFNENEAVLLDITVHSTIENYSNNTIKDLFLPLQELKNKTFFDSITARALIKYTGK